MTCRHDVFNIKGLYKFLWQVTIYGTFFYILRQCTWSSHLLWTHYGRHIDIWGILHASASRAACHFDHQKWKAWFSCLYFVCVLGSMSMGLCSAAVWAAGAPLSIDSWYYLVIWLKNAYNNSSILFASHSGVIWTSSLLRVHFDSCLSLTCHFAFCKPAQLYSE